MCLSFSPIYLKLFNFCNIIFLVYSTQCTVLDSEVALKFPPNFKQSFNLEPFTNFPDPVRNQLKRLLKRELQVMKPKHPTRRRIESQFLIQQTLVIMSTHYKNHCVITSMHYKSDSVATSDKIPLGMFPTHIEV